MRRAFTSMPFQQINSEVYVANGNTITLGSGEISLLKQRLANAPRGRVRLCAHPGNDDLLHEMIIALSRQSYIRPHRHPNKSESFHIIQGAVDIIIFDDVGGITDRLSLGDLSTGLPMFYRLNAPLFHTLIIRSDVLVFHETTNGPLRAGDAEFAAWAPAAEDQTAARQYMTELERSVQMMRKQPAPVILP